MLAQQQTRDLTLAEQSEIARVAALQGEHERLEAAHLRYQAQLRQRAARRSTTAKAAGMRRPLCNQISLQPVDWNEHIHYFTTLTHLIAADPRKVEA
jgi:hypothetical protein